MKSVVSGAVVALLAVLFLLARYLFRKGLALKAECALSRKGEASVKDKKAAGSPRYTRGLVFAVGDVLVLMVSYVVALMIRYDFTYSQIPLDKVFGYLASLPFTVASTLLVFYIFHLYHSIWSYAGIIEIRNITGAFLVLIPVYYLGYTYMGLTMPIAYYLMGFVISVVGCISIRFGYRFLRMFRGRSASSEKEKKEERVMVIGAGSAGQMVIQELQITAEMNAKVCCAIDDNPTKVGRYIQGVEIVGDRYSIVQNCVRYQISLIIFAIPTCEAQSKKEILDICKESGCRLQVMPGISQLVNNKVSLSQLRDVEISDLLGREQIRVNNQECFDALNGKVVLVTGGGGSIGSELSRQIAAAKPKKLIIFDIYENNAYEIQQELKRKLPDLNLEVLIGSVRNTLRVEGVMEKYRPDFVFHAAAHKHVPLMEDSPCEAIKNNVFGTYKTAVAADKYGVKKFILISTDKAVNPTNIMGASKRLCEMVVQMMNRKSQNTQFVAVRFGNVLGSNGSVIPLFKKQIAQGGPVTVTDKRIIRYFMTIPEAVSLILQAFCYANGGEIFVLDMGEPVKIDDMARNLIRLSGYRPDVDIKIVYTGLRPGEKLYEELLMDEEGLSSTQNELIHIGKPIAMDDEVFCIKLKELELASKNESDRIRELVSEMVPTYRWNR